MRIFSMIPMLLLCVAPAAHAGTVQFCMRATVDYADSGFTLTNDETEDYWNSPGEQWMRGTFVTIKVPPYSTALWSGCLLYTSRCV